MQSPTLRQKLQWQCLLLLCMAFLVWATPEEGTILLNWKRNLTHSGGKLANWGAASSDPCGSNPWFYVSCDKSGYVQQVDLGSSELTGTLVAELGQLSKLMSLNLYNNSFSGWIPEELGNLTSLTYLNLSKNQLSGPIPDSLGKLSSLESLNLNSNSLSGSFPVSLLRLYQLSRINLDSNSITGVVNVTRILDIIGATANIYEVQPLGLVSLMNNMISNVVYQPDDLLNGRTVFKLQGNPYCDASVELYDDGRRCLCQQNCSITPSQEGSILFNWKSKLANGDKLTNWAGPSDPCGSIPWVHVFCNSGHVQRIDLGSSGLSGPLAPELGQLSKLEQLALNDNSFYGSIPQELGNLAALSYLDLSGNQLSGSIPDSIQNLTSLSFLILSNNNFSGSFPESLLKLSRTIVIQLDSNSITGAIKLSQTLLPSRLSTVSLKNNYITDVVRQPNVNVQYLGLNLLGNPYCANSTESYDSTRRCYCLQICHSITTYVKRTAIIIGIVGSAGCLVLAIIFVVMFKIHAKRKLRKIGHQMEVEYRRKFAEFEVNPQPFLYCELRLATQDFNESTKLGQGSFGAVYKGTLSNGNQVAIKKLKPIAALGVEVDGFLNEVVFITKMKHRNLVDLKGYCMRGKERMLVYEFVENTDVEQSLLEGKSKEAMTWPVRFNICLGVAQGLHYLHTYAQPRVIHRDIKASNILLDSRYAPKIADFGLALLFPDEKSHISTATVAGTRGYLAPEYASYGELSEKADVYSFGVLCLEIVSGRTNIDHSKPLKQLYLPNWAWSLRDEGKLKDLIDPSLHLRLDEEFQALLVINTALSCLRQIPERRPSMSDVQTTLQGNMKLDEAAFQNWMRLALGIPTIGRVPNSSIWDGSTLLIPSQEGLSTIPTTES